MKGKLVIGAVSALIGALSVTPLQADDRQLKGRLSGFQEVPPISTVASGEFEARISHDDTSIAYELSYSGLEGTVTQAHIHFGQRNVAGGISVFLCQTATNPDPTGLAPTCLQEGSVSGVITAANIIGPAGQGIAPGELAELIRAIRAGRAYANVHSSKFPAGEVRGQIR